MSQARPTKSEIDKYSAHFVLHGEQSNAWRVAYPESKCKQKQVHTRASLMHAMAEVQQRVKEFSESARLIAESEFNLDAEYVAKRLKEIDELDVLDIMEDDLKSFKKLSDWPKAWRTSISGLDLMTLSNGNENIEAIVKKVKWPDKTKNLELIGKLTKVSAFSENLNIRAGEEMTPWGQIKASVDKKDGDSK